MWNYWVSRLFFNWGIIYNTKTQSLFHHFSEFWQSYIHINTTKRRHSIYITQKLLSAPFQLVPSLSTTLISVSSGWHMFFNLRIKAEKWKMRACKTQTPLKSMILGIQWIKEEGKKAKSWWERKKKEDKTRAMIPNLLCLQ